MLGRHWTMLRSHLQFSPSLKDKLFLRLILLWDKQWLGISVPWREISYDLPCLHWSNMGIACIHQAPWCTHVDSTQFQCQHTQTSSTTGSICRSGWTRACLVFIFDFIFYFIFLLFNLLQAKQRVFIFILRLKIKYFTKETYRLIDGAQCPDSEKIFVSSYKNTISNTREEKNDWDKNHCKKSREVDSFKIGWLLMAHRTL